MNTEIINQILDSFLIFKLGLLVLIAFHAVFLFVVFTQITSMNRIINQSNASSLLRLVAILALVFSISLFIVAIVIL